jgi:hypothetical protein
MNIVVTNEAIENGFSQRNGWFGRLLAKQLNQATSRRTHEYASNVPSVT